MHIIKKPQRSADIVSNQIYLPSNASKARHREAENARKNRVEIVKAWSQGQVSRRELFKWALFTTPGVLAPIRGLNLFVGSAYGDSIPTGAPLSPLFGVKPFTQPVPRFDVLPRNPVSSLNPGKNIELISKKLGLYAEPDPSDRDGHAPAVLIGNERTGQWIRNSALDNPRYLAVMIGDWLNSWKAGSHHAKSYAEAPRLSITDRGQYIFATQCAACHSIGRGDKIGPDLQGVTKVRDRAWLSHFIQTPDKMLIEKDPVATVLFEKYQQVNMPNLRLGDVDANAGLNSLETSSSQKAGVINTTGTER